MSACVKHSPSCAGVVYINETYWRLAPGWPSTWCNTLQSAGPSAHNIWMRIKWTLQSQLRLSHTRDDCELQVQTSVSCLSDFNVSLSLKSTSNSSHCLYIRQAVTHEGSAAHSSLHFLFDFLCWTWCIFRSWSLCSSDEFLYSVSSEESLYSCIPVYKVDVLSVDADMISCHFT